MARQRALLTLMRLVLSLVLLVGVGCGGEGGDVAGTGGSAASGGSAGSGGIGTGRCTVWYDLDVTFRTSEEGATILPGATGAALVQYTADDSGNIIEGPVGLLYYWVFQNVIAANSDAADDYWSNDANAYTVADTSTGAGCLNDFHNVGNINCEADASQCALGNFAVGDNPLHDRWTQPLINGTGASGTNSASIRDAQASMITSPTGASDGFLSFNLPNDGPGRTWIGWVGTRDASSELTTCR